MNNTQTVSELKTAFILAAGLGTRLKPYTDSMPKALVPYKGKPMIENVISKLEKSGYNKIFINTHHFHEKMDKYFSERMNSGNIKLVYEKEILGTGGALKNLLQLLDENENTLIYNTDVDCDVDLNTLPLKLYETNADAVLCVQNRKTSRYLLFSENGILLGRTEEGIDKLYVNNSGNYYKQAFCGIHIIKNSLINDFEDESGYFDIIPQYMKLISRGKKIVSYDISGAGWKDLGIPQNL